jgi:hypothetical protein
MQKHVLGILVLAASWGCGGEGGGAGPSASGVSGHMLIIDIKDADAQALCKFERDRYTAGLPDEKAYCTFFSHEGDDTERCEMYRDECIAADDYENELADDWECDGVTAEEYTDDVDPKNCKATVADYEACIKQATDLRLAAMKAASCDALGGDSEDGQATACIELEQKCPSHIAHGGD